MPDGYNFIFDKLVESDRDFVGMVAYTIYKRQKIEWLRQFEMENQRRATDEEVEAQFANFTNLPSQIAAYKEQAIGEIDDFLDFALQEKVSEARQVIRDDAIVTAVRRSFVRAVFENALGGVVASLLTFGAIGIFWVASQGPERLVREAIKNYTSAQTLDSGRK